MRHPLLDLQPHSLFSPDDCKKLYRDFGISVRNCVELSLLARTVDNARWKGRYTNSLGLARLVETYEQATLPKGKTARSNWEQCLNPLQLECKSTHPTRSLTQTLPRCSKRRTRWIYYLFSPDHDGPSHESGATIHLLFFQHRRWGSTRWLGHPPLASS